VNEVETVIWDELEVPRGMAELVARLDGLRCRRVIQRTVAAMVRKGQLARLGSHQTGQYCRAGAVYLTNGYTVPGEDEWTMLARWRARQPKERRKPT
jgi:hypothetical protein